MNKQWIALLFCTAFADVALAQAPVGTPPLPGAAPSTSAPGSSGLPGGRASPTAPPAPSMPTIPGIPNTPVPAVSAPATSTESIATRFTALDKNGDGSLSADEMNSMRGNTETGSSATQFKLTDSNHDGKISAAEYAASEAAVGAKAPPQR